MARETIEMKTVKCMMKDCIYWEETYSNDFISYGECSRDEISIQSFKTTNLAECMQYMLRPTKIEMTD